MKVLRKNMLIVTEDHGGYMAGFCAICGVAGWIDSIKHKKDCPVASESKYLNIEVSK